MRSRGDKYIYSLLRNLLFYHNTDYEYIINKE
jgi:hypothetical protein